MSPQTVMAIGQGALEMTLLVSAPLLLAALIALPFKLMLFVLVDGWNLLLGSLAQSFAT